jgi:DNA polymerase III delta prime subunit
MSFEAIIGQPLAVKLVQDWLAKATNQPLLFYGPDGVGKRTLALEAAKALNCQFTSPSPSMGEGRDEGETKKETPHPAPSPAPPLRLGGPAEASVAGRGEGVLKCENPFSLSE